MSQTTQPLAARPIATVLAFAAPIVCVAMGIRHTFGLFLTPMSMEHQWPREVFSFAMAFQNLMWGAAQPFAGLLADRLGPRRVLLGGGVLYALGLLGMAWSTTGTGLAASGGLMIGMAQSATTYTIVFAALGRLVPEARRPWAMGVVAAAGSFGQFLMIPVGSVMISGLGWYGTLLIYALGAFLILPLGVALTQGIAEAKHGAGQTVGQALREASRDKSFLLLNGGYFVCGFQVVFIGVHFPTYLIDKGMNASVGVTALALIGLFNVFGSYGVGHLATRFSKRYVLAANYFMRSVVISGFLLAPLSHASVYIFSALMGLLWLSTVPPTNAIVAQIFGLRFFGMLSGVVFFSHQVGSFIGVWLGGRLFDATGNYNIIWGVCIALGVVAALLNLPIDEREPRLQPAT